MKISKKQLIQIINETQSSRIGYYPPLDKELLDDVLDKSDYINIILHSNISQEELEYVDDIFTGVINKLSKY